MARIFLVQEGGEIGRRRRLIPPSQLVEAWPDTATAGLVWMGETSKMALDGVGGPMASILTIDGAHVPIYYGPRLADIGSLPSEESLQARILSGRGIAGAWITLDQFGERVVHKAESPLDPVFFLRRPGTASAHQWRLFRTRAEAVVFMQEYYGNDPEAQEWAAALPVASHEELLQRHAGPEPEPTA